VRQGREAAKTKLPKGTPVGVPKRVATRRP